MKLVVFALAMLAALPAFAQAQPDPIVTVALSASQWNTVLQGLGELPLKTAFPLVQNIQMQAKKQLDPVDEPKKEKK